MRIQRHRGRPVHDVEHSYKLGRRGRPHQFLKARDDIGDRLVLGQQVLLNLLRLLQDLFSVLVGILGAFVRGRGLDVLPTMMMGNKTSCKKPLEIRTITKNVPC